MASSAGKRRKGGKKDPAVSGAKRQHEDTTAAASSSESGERFTFFFGAESPFSQWHSATFTVACLKYNCAEQYMMHQKAGKLASADRALVVWRSHTLWRWCHGGWIQWYVRIYGPHGVVAHSHVRAPSRYCTANKTTISPYSFVQR